MNLHNHQNWSECTNMITIKRPRYLLDTAASDPTSYCRELTRRKLFQGNEGCSPGVTAHPAALLLLRRAAAQEEFQKLLLQFQMCSSLKEHTPTKWQGGPHRLSRAQHNKQANKQTHLTAKKESPKAAADFPLVPVVISHQITAL